MKNWLYNSNVIITGSSSGIGFELTKILIEEFGCSVLGFSRNEERLKKQKLALKENSSKFSYFVGDVSKLEDWQKLKEFLNDKEFNLIINNAGTMLPFLRAQNISILEAKRVFETNFFSILYCFNVLSDYFSKKKNGGIINIASASALCSVPGQSIYSASKSAVTSYSKILQSENRNLFIGTYPLGFTLTNIFFSKDNEKAVFDQKSMRIIKHFCTSALKMARKIINSIKKKKPYKVLGNDAKLLRFLGKVAPVQSSKIIGLLFKSVNLSCFDDLNKVEKKSKDS
ncbi:MAG: SDR family NAD(P)-dependent oxidoreductase [Clostridia bacterium]|nr:SDR family NAD(P)-dependent oxidoreductase [Clostridia bacterium]